MVRIDYWYVNNILKYLTTKDKLFINKIMKHMTVFYIIIIIVSYFIQGG